MLLFCFFFFVQDFDSLGADLKKAMAESAAPDLIAIYEQHRPKGPLPEDEQFLNGLGYFLMRQEKPKLARTIFEHNIQLFPKRSNTHYSLGEWFFKYDDPKKALAQFRKAYDMDKADYAWERMEDVLQKLDDREASFKYAQEGLNRRENANSLDLFLATTIKQKREPQPLKAFRKAQEKYPKNSFWRTRFAMEKAGISIPELANAWKHSSYQAVGLDPKPFETLVSKAQKGDYRGLHGLVVVKGDAIIGEAYFEGYAAFRPHDTRSVGKSFTALIAGIAVDQGKLAENRSIYDYYPDIRKQADWQSEKDQVHLAHLLGMSSGLDAFDDQPDSPGNENYYQSNLENWGEHALNLKRVFKPGSKLVYASANYLLVANLVAQATQTPTDTFAHKHLFAPLGITYYQWYRAPNGEAYGAGGMRITPRDMAKIGALVRDKGRWQGQQIVSKEWIAKATRPQFEGQFWGKNYGYGWYVHDVQAKGQTIQVISAAGNGGQRIWVMPQLDAVAVLTMGRYNSPKQQLADELLTDIIVPSLIKE